MPLRTTGIIVDKTGCRHLPCGDSQLLYGETPGKLRCSCPRVVGCGIIGLAIPDTDDSMLKASSGTVQRHLASLYAESADKDVALAEAGLSEHADLLAHEDSAT
jgi:hypothetical protein